MSKRKKIVIGSIVGIVALGAMGSLAPVEEPAAEPIASASPEPTPEPEAAQEPNAVTGGAPANLMAQDMYGADLGVLSDQEFAALCDQSRDPATMQPYIEEFNAVDGRRIVATQADVDAWYESACE